jgi:hypothetical protein
MKAEEKRKRIKRLANKIDEYADWFIEQRSFEELLDFAAPLHGARNSKIVMQEINDTIHNVSISAD